MAAAVPAIPAAPSTAPQPAAASLWVISVAGIAAAVGVVLLAATSEGLHANRIARLFWPSHPSHAAEDQRVDLRSESLAPDEAPTGKPTHDPENRGA